MQYNEKIDKEITNDVMSVIGQGFSRSEKLGINFSEYLVCFGERYLYILDEIGKRAEEFQNGKES